MLHLKLTEDEAKLLSCALGIVEATRLIGDNSSEMDTVVHFEEIRDSLEVQYTELAETINVPLLQTNLEVFG